MSKFLGELRRAPLWAALPVKIILLSIGPLETIAIAGEQLEREIEINLNHTSGFVMIQKKTAC